MTLPVRIYLYLYIDICFIYILHNTLQCSDVCFSYGYSRLLSFDDIKCALNNYLKQFIINNYYFSNYLKRPYYLIFITELQYMSVTALKLIKGFWRSCG